MQKSKSYRINLTIDDEFETALEYYRSIYPFMKDNEIIKAVFSFSIGQQKTLQNNPANILKKISRKYQKKNISWSEEQALINQIEE